jgi:hypothetical protein
MNFTSQICTTRVQSERLLALGLKRETADCILVENPFKPNNYVMFPIVDIDETLENEMNSEPIPAWSLHRLIEILDIWYLDLNFNNFYNAYEQVISYLEERVKGGFINKDYLEK